MNSETTSNESGDQKRRHHETFTDPLLASAGLDRLMHRAEAIIIRGSSFRAKGRQQLEQEVLSSKQSSF